MVSCGTKFHRIPMGCLQEEFPVSPTVQLHWMTWGPSPSQSIFSTLCNLAHLYHVLSPSCLSSKLKSPESCHLSYWGSCSSPLIIWVALSTPSSRSTLWILRCADNNCTQFSKCGCIQVCSKTLWYWLLRFQLLFWSVTRSSSFSLQPHIGPRSLPILLFIHLDKPKF